MPGRLALLAGLAEGLSRTDRPLRSLLAKPHAGLLEFARQTAFASAEPPPRRVLAVRVLSQGDPRPDMLSLLQPREPAVVRAAVAQGLGKLGDKNLAGAAIKNWGRYSLDTRRALITAFLRTPHLARVLVEAIEKEELAAAEIEPAARETLLRIPDAGLQNRARKLLDRSLNPDRQAIVKKYQSALRLQGDRRRGQLIFQKHCQSCHQLEGQGHRVGPDLSGVQSRPREALLVDLFDPSREVPPDYRSFVLVTKRGQILTGLLASETAATVTLRRAEGIEETAPRTEIEALHATQKSLMPEGMEQVLSFQDVADLVEVLVGRR